MALAPAEKQQRYRDKLKAQAQTRTPGVHCAYIGGMAAIVRIESPVAAEAALLAEVGRAELRTARVAVSFQRVRGTNPVFTTTRILVGVKALAAFGQTEP